MPSKAVAIAALAATSACLGVGASAAAPSRPPAARSHIVVTCINTKTGAMRIKPANHTCRRDEVKRSWLDPVATRRVVHKGAGTGPAGAPGATGPAGASGATGATGPAGGGGGAGAGCELVRSPTPSHFTDCQHDLTSLWGRSYSTPTAQFGRWANFTGSDLSLASFNSTDLSYAVFRNATLRGTDLRGADLTGADLTNADLTREWGPNSVLDGTTVLTGTIWANTICPDGTNSDANGNTCVGHF